LDIRKRNDFFGKSERRLLDNIKIYLTYVRCQQLDEDLY